MKTLPLALALIVCAHTSRAQEKSAFASFIELPWRHVIGGHSAAKLHDSEAAGRLLGKPGISYRVFSLKGPAGSVTAGKAAPEADVCPDVWMQIITPRPDPSAPVTLGVNASWDPMPRAAVMADTGDGALAAVVRGMLVKRGIAIPEVKIHQRLQIDLDGDGRAETLVAARRFVNEVELFSAAAGDYCLVFMERETAKGVTRQILHGDAYPRADPEAAPSIHEITGLLDLDGDGRLEVITHTGYYEGGGCQVWELRGDELVKVIELDCGV